MVDIASLQIEIKTKGVKEAIGDLNNLSSSAKKTSNEVENLSKKSEDSSKSTESAGASFKKLGAVLAGLGLAAAAKGFIEIADSMNLLEARIKLAERGLNTYKQTQEKLLQIANENRSSIKATTELYVKLVDPIRQLGGTTQTAMNVTSAFSKALMLGGASTAEAASATLQFAQAMGSGVLRGDEFNSIAEASPRILRAVSESLGVAQGALKKMAEEGKLTAGVVGGALLESMSQFQLEAKQMPLTVAGSFQILKNNLADTIHKMDEATGVSSSLASAITSVTDTIMSNTNALMNSTSEFSDWIKKRSDGINTLGYIFEMVFGGIVKAAEIAFGIITGWVTKLIDGIGFVGRLFGIVNGQGKTAAQVEAEKAKQLGVQADYQARLLSINQQLNAPPMTKAAKEKIDMIKKQTETIKKLVDIEKQRGLSEDEAKTLIIAETALQDMQNNGSKVMKKNADAMVKADEAKKKAAEAAKKATSEAAKLAKEWADEEQKINLKVAQSTENKYVQDVLAAQKHYDDRMAYYKNDAKKQIKLNEGLQADLAKIQKEATKDYQDELEKKAKIDAEWAVKIFEFSDKISDAIIEQNAKMYGNEQISEIDKWYNVQLEALGKLTAEIPMTTQQVDELITKIQQLRSLRITEQTLSFKIEKTFFKSLEDGLQEAIEDAFNGKLSIEKFFNTIKNNLLKTLTGDVSSSIAGLFKGASLFGSETGGAPDFLSTVASMVGSISSDTILQTAGGTIIDKLTGAITQQGSDIETITKVATSGGGGIGDIFGNLSNIQSIATLPQKYQSLVSFVQNPAGWMSNFGATTGGFTGDMAAGFSNWMAGGGSSSAGLGTGSLGGKVGYYGGGMATGAGLGYATGFIGDRIFGSQTQASNFGAAGGVIGSLAGPIGTAAGIAIGSLLGGAIGTQKEDNKAIDIFKASSEGVTGQDRITYKTKSWYGVKTDVSTQMFDEATAKSIQKVIESYDYMLNQLGDFDKIVVENKAFESVAKFVDEGITKAFLQAAGQANVDAVYTAWTEYAKSIDKTTQEAFATQIQALITTKRGFDEWYLNFTGDTTGALKFKADYLTKDLEKLKESMGATGVTAADFAAKMDAAVKENFTPETIANWQALGQTIQVSEEATRAYQTALAQNIATIDAIIEKSKGQDSTQQKYLKTIENLTGITMNSISDIEKVGNSLKGIPNITSDAINAFGSLSDSITAMQNKVQNSIKASIASVRPETVNLKSDYEKAFGFDAPTTLDEWQAQGEEISKNFSGIFNTIEDRVASAYKLNLGRDADEGGFNYWVEQIKSGVLAVDDFLGEFNKATQATGNADMFTIPTISDEDLSLYNSFGQALKAVETAAQTTTTTLDTTTTAIDDFTSALNSLSSFAQEFAVWSLENKGDNIGAVKLQVDYAVEAVKAYETQLGESGINIDNYIVKMIAGSSAIPENAKLWEEIGRSLILATDLEKEYQAVIESKNRSIDEIVMRSKGYDVAMINNIKTIQNLTGITMRSIKDVDTVANSLRDIPNVTDDAINAFGSLTDAIVAMNKEVTTTIDGIVKSVLPETDDYKNDYIKIFGSLPSTVEEWIAQGKAFEKKVEEGTAVAPTAIPMNTTTVPTTPLATTTTTIPSFTLPDNYGSIYQKVGEDLTKKPDVVDTTPIVDPLNYMSEYMKTYQNWMIQDDDIKILEKSKQSFEDFQKEIGITGITVETFADKFGEALKVGLTDDALKLWESMGGALTEFVDRLKTIRDTWQDMATSFGDAADDIRGKTTKSFAEIRAIAPTPDNYQDLISMLNESREKEIDNLNKASKLRIDALEKEKQRIVDITNLIKSLSKRIIDVQPANNADYRNEITKVKEAISKGLDIDLGDLTSATSTYLDKTLKESTSKLDYITETAKVREEVNGLKGMGTGATLEDIETAIKNEEWALKAAIDNVNNSAIAILDGWREFSLENTNLIIEAILSLKVPELATYQPSTQPIGAAGITPSSGYIEGKLYDLVGSGKVVFDNEAEYLSYLSQGRIDGSKVAPIQPTGAAGITPLVTNAIPNSGYIEGKLYDLVGSGKSVFDNEAEYLSYLSQGRIDGSHANGLDYVPFDGYMAELHRGERVKTKGQARQEDSERDSLKADIAELKAINLKNTAELMRMSKVITRADDGDALRVRVTA